MDDCKQHATEIQFKIDESTELNSKIPLAIEFYFKAFLLGNGRRVEAAIDITYMEYLYKIPLTLISIVPNITHHFREYEKMASSDIMDITEEEGKLFSQRIDRKVMFIDNMDNSTIVQKVFHNMTEEYRERCETNNERFETILEEHRSFLNETFFDGPENIIKSITKEKVRFHFIDFLPIQPKIDENLSRMKAAGNTTIELLEEAWYIATSELFYNIASVKALIMIEVDRLNEIIAPGHILYVLQKKQVDQIEDIVKDAFEQLDDEAEQFSNFEKTFLDELKEAVELNATMAKKVYDPQSICEPQWAYTLTGIKVNKIAHEAFVEFYKI